MPHLPVEVPDCGDCHGSLIDVDRDGSLTGEVGRPVPCACLMFEEASPVGCPCHLPSWPHGEGHTGWIPRGVYGDDELWYWPCPVHPRLSALAVVA